MKINNMLKYYCFWYCCLLQQLLLVWPTNISAAAGSA